MNSQQRKFVYAALMGINAVLLVLMQQHVLPAQYVQYATIFSLGITTVMKEWSAVDPQAASPEVKK